MRRIVVLVGLVGLGAGPGLAEPPKQIALSPVAMAGPYKSAHEACVHAPPCGFTDMTETGKYIKPATKTSCPGLEGGDKIDPNASDPVKGMDMAQLSHRSKDLELRIGSQRCAEPEGIRGERDIYFVFAKRADGWWRSAPVWEWSYNDKYAGGTMHVRWNDQPGRTFAGIAAGLDELTCNKQATAHSTLELMIRIEPGGKTPVVFAPLVVGERASVEVMDQSSTDCKPSKHADELDEHWPSDDELELTGAATWHALDREPGYLRIGFGMGQAPSSVGRYRFTR